MELTAIYLLAGFLAAVVTGFSFLKGHLSDTFQHLTVGKATLDALLHLLPQ